MSMSHKIAVALFALMITMPFIGEYAVHGSRSDWILETENHRLTPYQELTAFKKRAIIAYFRNLDHYIADRLALKDDVVTSVQHFTGDPELFFKLDIEKGVIGKDGYVFLGNSFNQVLDRHFNQSYFPQQKGIDLFVADQIGFKQKAADLGADYMLFVAPDKHGIYCDVYPRQLMDPTGCADSDRVTRAMTKILQDHGIDVSFPFALLKQRKDERRYQKTDSHWNLKGAGYGFQQLIADINEKHDGENSIFWKRPDYTEHREHQVGGLGVTAGMAKDLRIDDVAYDLTDDPMVSWREGSGNFKTVPNHEAIAQGMISTWSAEMLNPRAFNERKVMVVCDSFMSMMSPHMNLHFSHVLYATRHFTNEKLTQMMHEFKPDLVIYEIVERGMY